MTPTVSERVAYADIPREARDIADEVYTPDGVVIWWNSRNKTLSGERPRDCDLATVVNRLNALADGNFA